MIGPEESFELWHEGLIDLEAVAVDETDEADLTDKKIQVPKSPLLADRNSLTNNRRRQQISDELPLSDPRKNLKKVRA
jgi:hypothetical protein